MMIKQIYGNIDLTGQMFEATEKFSESIQMMMTEVVTEALTLALESDYTYASMPAVWGTSDGMGGPACADPLTVYLHLDLGKTEDTSVVLQVNFLSRLDRYIESCAEDGGFSDGLTRIRDALRELADRIDNAISSAPTDHDDTTRQRGRDGTTQGEDGLSV